ncbi:MAG: tRNA (adenosine(37)-N6)-dimethylallyltransferase MiaA, partial [Promethearchaeota archaeon]
MKRKLIAVIGPTASGKTSLAIKIAKKLNGELINADSRQIYKYMDIGTAKGDVKKIRNSKLKTLEIYQIEGVPIHLINIVAPDEVLTLAQYQKLAYATIDHIAKRGKLPILVGGTGLYVDAVVKGYKIPKVKPDMRLRGRLDSKTVSYLQNILKKLNKNQFDSLNESDKKNKHRLIRLIELVKNTKDSKRKLSEAPEFDVLFLTPAYTRDGLYETINRRAKIILKSGLIDEVKGLIKKGFKFTKPAMTAISYPIVK